MNTTEHYYSSRITVIVGSVCTCQYFFVSVLLLQNIRGEGLNVKHVKIFPELNQKYPSSGQRESIRRETQRVLERPGREQWNRVPGTGQPLLFYDRSRDRRTKSAIIATETYSRQCSTKSAFSKYSRDALRVGSR